MTEEKATALVHGALEKLESDLRDGQSDTLKAYLKAMSRFTRYSLGNVLLIASQNPRATNVAGFRAWQDLGRHVRKGERSIVILAPMRWRRRVRNGGENANRRADNTTVSSPVKADMLLGFKRAHVFDISQTDGKPLPEFARVGRDPEESLDRLKQFAADRKIRVEFTDSLGTAEGASRGGHVRIRNGLTPAEQFSTLTHEFAHELLHHDGKERSRTIKETEAEAVAYVVCEATGLECGSAASDYIQLYDGKPETLLESLRRIQETAKTIIEMLDMNESTMASSHRSDGSPVIERAAA